MISLSPKPDSWVPYFPLFKAKLWNHSWPLPLPHSLYPTHHQVLSTLLPKQISSLSAHFIFTCSSFHHLSLPNQPGLFQSILHTDLFKMLIYNYITPGLNTFSGSLLFLDKDKTLYHGLCSSSAHQPLFALCFIFTVSVSLSSSLSYSYLPQGLCTCYSLYLVSPSVLSEVSSAIPS